MAGAGFNSGRLLSPPFDGVVAVAVSRNAVATLVAAPHTARPATAGGGVCTFAADAGEVAIDGGTTWGDAGAVVRVVAVDGITRSGTAAAVPTLTGDRASEGFFFRDPFFGTTSGVAGG